MSDILERHIIPLFTYGTLMQNNKFSFYLKGTQFVGKYYTEGQLMKAPNGSVYIDKKYKQVATIGELYYVDYYTLQGINHLEVLSGEFPVGYELAITRIWKLKNKGEFDFSSENYIYAFYYRRKNHPVKILTGDYNDDFNCLEELGNYMKKHTQATTEDIIKHMLLKMSIWDYE